MDAVVNTVCFLVPEPHKTRNRVIAWPIWANDQADKMPYEWDHTTSIQTDIIDIARSIYNFTHAAVFDLRCSFFQIPISSVTSYAFVFEFKGRKYAWTRLPMGYTSSAELMQIVCQELAKCAIKKAGLTGHPSLTFHVHVDNILFLADEQSIAAVICAMNEIATAHNIVLSEGTTVPMKEVPWCGLTINLPRMPNTVLRNVNTVLCNVNTVLCNVNVVLCNVNTVLCNVNTVQTEYCAPQREHCALQREYCALQREYCALQREYCAMQREYALSRIPYHQRVYMAWDGFEAKYGVLGEDSLRLTMVGHGGTQMPDAGPHSVLRVESRHQGRKTGGVRKRGRRSRL